MMPGSAAWRRWWDAPAPALRLAIVRALVGVYCLALCAVIAAELPRLLALPAARFAPVGLLTWSPGPPGAALTWLGLAATVTLGLMFTCGVRYRGAAPLLAVALLWLTSLRHSWGHLGHGEHLVVLHVLVLAVAPAADAASVDARRRSATTAADPGRYGWPLRVMAMTTILTYALAGWAKLHTDAVGWLQGDAVRLQVAFDAARKARLGVTPPLLARWLVPYAGAFAPLSALTLLVELGGVVALAGRRAAIVWSAAAWTMHVGIAAVMGISFGFPLFGLAFAPLLRVERVAAAARRAWRRHGRRR
jgi:hypothetical protein